MGMMFTTAFCFSSIAVMTRKMKEIHFSLLMFHYGLFATVILGSILIIEYLGALYKGHLNPKLHLFCYNWQQWIQLIAVGILNCSSMNFMTIAQQLEKSAFVSSITYIQLVYVLFIDIGFFHIKFDMMELVGATIIVIFNVSNIVYKLKN